MTDNDSASMIDLLDLPATQRHIVLYLLRHRSATHQRLSEYFGDTSLFEETLSDLIRLKWVTKSHHGACNDYRLATVRRTTALETTTGLWQKVDVETLGNAHYEPTFAAESGSPLYVREAEPHENSLMRRGGKRTLPDSIWGKLSPPNTAENSETHLSADDPHEQPDPQTPLKKRTSLLDSLDL